MCDFTQLLASLNSCDLLYTAVTCTHPAVTPPYKPVTTSRQLPQEDLEDSPGEGATWGQSELSCGWMGDWGVMGNEVAQVPEVYTTRESRAGPWGWTDSRHITLLGPIRLDQPSRNRPMGTALKW